jgi:lysine 2,3-aminomutase
VSAELETRPCELADPLGEREYSPLPRLVHRHADRALLLVTDQCAIHCRHCFRSRFTAGGRGAISGDELAAVETYLRRHPDIRELILSGGDALMVSDRQLARILAAAREARPGITLRVGTRAPVMLPSRVTPALVRILRGNAPLWIVTQVNHPEELDRESAGALGRLVDAGLPVMNQSVLLAGVNDDADTLERLFRELVAHRVKPYYLFQGDLAPGTAHFRVNLERATSIVAELRSRLSGLAMPVFAVDIPGGAGKVPLEPSALTGQDAEGYLLAGRDGRVHHYPREGV